MLKNNRFTLIELLVIVAIIGILVSMLLPSLTMTRLKAQMAVCQSNLNQIGKGVSLYGNSNKNYFPKERRSDAFFAWGGNSGSTSYWSSEGTKDEERPLYEYVDPRAFECPSSDKQDWVTKGSDYRANVGDFWYLPKNSIGSLDVNYEMMRVNDPARMGILAEGGLFYEYMKFHKLRDYKYFNHFDNDRWVLLHADNHTSYVKGQMKMQANENYTLNNQK